MPTPRAKHRTYCKTCKDFTIHTADYICQTCDTEFTSYFPSEVDSVLVEQQKQRFNAQRNQNMGSLYKAFAIGTGLEAMVNTDWKPTQVIECDAGQKEINNRKKEQREELKRKHQEILDDYNNYKHLNRNEKCTCESGKKFKQCHLLYFQKYLKL